MRISFVWQGVSDPVIRNGWKDGLYAAMQIIEKQHTVTYNEPFDDITDVDIILYWEAPTTINGQNQTHYNKVRNNPIKKALLFAGGPLQKEWVEGFDHIFVESKINAEECEKLGLSHSTAFGINDKIFKPLNVPKVFNAIHHGASSSWKRQWLMAESISNTVICGRYQEEDPEPFDRSRRAGTLILPQLPQELVACMINASRCLAQTSEFWGGGQRATLEAMACGVPVIVMTDSPKNIEYVEESGFGEIVTPSNEQIKLGFDRLMEKNFDPQIGVDYIKSKYTAQHYADSLLKGIEQICS